MKNTLKRDGVELNEDKSLLTSLTKACRVRNDLVQTRLPIRKSLLTLMVKSVDTFYLKNPQPYLTCLYKTILVTAYYGLFSIGELAQGPHVLKVADVHIGENKDKLMFVLHSSKTHGKDAKPQIIKIDALPKSLATRQGAPI